MIYESPFFHVAFIFCTNPKKKINLGDHINWFFFSNWTNGLTNVIQMVSGKKRACIRLLEIIPVAEVHRGASMCKSRHDFQI